MEENPETKACLLYTSMMPFVVAAVFYFVFNLLVAIVMDKIEKKMNYYR